MASLSLKISIPEKNTIKTIQFDPSTLVYEACHLITEKIAEVNQGLGSSKDYGLFLTDDDPKKGVWLEAGRRLDYYLLRNGVSLTIPRMNSLIVGKGRQEQSGRNDMKERVGDIKRKKSGRWRWKRDILGIEGERDRARDSGVKQDRVFVRTRKNKKRMEREKGEIGGLFERVRDEIFCDRVHASSTCNELVCCYRI